MRLDPWRYQKISSLRISNTPNPPDWQISRLADWLEFLEREDLVKKVLTNAEALPLRECLELCGRQVEWGAKTRGICAGGAALQVSSDRCVRALVGADWWLCQRAPAMHLELSVERILFKHGKLLQGLFNSGTCLEISQLLLDLHVGVAFPPQAFGQGGGSVPRSQ